MSNDCLITGNLTVLGSNNIPQLTTGETQLAIPSNQTIVGSVWTVCNLGITGNNDANISVSSGTITVNDDALYIISGDVTFNNNSTGTYRAMYANIDGDLYNSMLQVIRQPTGFHPVNFFTSRYLTAGQTIEIVANGDFTGAQTLVGVSGSINHTNITVTQIK